MKILNIEIDNLATSEIIAKIKHWIDNKKSFHSIATVNAEMIMAAQNNPSLLQAINQSDLKIPESTGVMWASQKLGQKFKERTPGVDLIWRLAKLSDKQHWRWFLLGSAPGVAKQASEKLKSKYPGIQIVGVEDGGVVTLENLKSRTDLVDKINQAQADILIVTFGVPKQELFMRTFKDQLTAKVGIGAGGTLDFISGKQKRAPKFMRSLGLEWLWRVLREPKRFKRIWTATVIFPKAVKKSLK